MKQDRPWYWAITERGQGPDYYFDATFAPQNAAQLAVLVQRYLPTGFVRNEAHTSAIQYLKQSEDVLILFSATIDVYVSRLSIYHQLGGGQDYGETSLLRDLAQSPELTLLQWRVGYGGDGYAHGDAAGGNGDTSLLAYLKPI